MGVPYTASLYVLLQMGITSPKVIAIRKSRDIVVVKPASGAVLARFRFGSPAQYQPVCPHRVDLPGRALDWQYFQHGPNT